MQSIPWWLYALLGALCAAFVGIFGKIGMHGVNADMATAIRSVVQAMFVVVFASVVGVMSNARQLHSKAVGMIVLSGIAGGLSWIFMFRALQRVDMSLVGPIDKLSMPLSIVLAVLILKERPTPMNWVGIVVMAGGAYLAAHRAVGKP